jgi:hypothetical protein
MTYRDELNKKSSYELYCIVAHYNREGGDLTGDDLKLFETEMESDIDDESNKEALVELVERLHDDDLL